MPTLLESSCCTVISETYMFELAIPVKPRLLQLLLTSSSCSHSNKSSVRLAKVFRLIYWHSVNGTSISSLPRLSQARLLDLPMRFIYRKLRISLSRTDSSCRLINNIYWLTEKGNCSIQLPQTVFINSESRKKKSKYHSEINLINLYNTSLDVVVGGVVIV